MLIRSQDRTEIVNISNVAKIILVGNSIVSEQINDKCWTTLGEYSEEKAIKVLDMIEQNYCNVQYVEYCFNGEVTVPYTIKNNIVFQMPEKDNG